MTNELLGRWKPDDEDDVPAAMKLTYLAILSYTRGDGRVAQAPSKAIARRLGITTETFNRHCVALEELEMIERHPMHVVSDWHSSNQRVFVVLDLPAFFRCAVRKRPSKRKVDVGSEYAPEEEELDEDDEDELDEDDDDEDELDEDDDDDDGDDHEDDDDDEPSPNLVQLRIKAHRRAPRERSR